VHIGATVQPRPLDGVWLAESYTDVHHDSARPPRVEGGRVRLPGGAGLGVVPDEGVFGEPVASFGVDTKSTKVLFDPFSRGYGGDVLKPLVIDRIVLATYGVPS
jgi:hypothetical protein